MKFKENKFRKTEYGDPVSTPWLLTNLEQFKGKAFVEDTVDPGTTQQLICVHLVPRTLNALLKVDTKLLDHPDKDQAK